MRKPQKRTLANILLGKSTAHNMNAPKTKPTAMPRVSSGKPKLMKGNRFGAGWGG